MCMEYMYRGSILWDTTFSYMCLCTEWMYFNSSLLIKESLQIEAIRSMAVKILMFFFFFLKACSEETY